VGFKLFLQIQSEKKRMQTLFFAPCGVDHHKNRGPQLTTLYVVCLLLKSWLSFPGSISLNLSSEIDTRNNICVAFLGSTIIYKENVIKRSTSSLPILPVSLSPMFSPCRLLCSATLVLFSSSLVHANYYIDDSHGTIKYSGDWWVGVNEEKTFNKT
jgi:hypothetical protein